MKEKSSPVSKSEKNNTGTSKNDDIGSVQSEMKTLQTMNDDIKIDKVSELVDDEIQRETIIRLTASIKLILDKTPEL
ncbi:unnamed protein product [Rotaria magnacalcarata]|uniref:Uncharacterized protein n=1 Tax=Rotaria magnacalcarata TaxID=392030 RepID=A0A8S3DG56_9BILA|nr:unnamed protein product [Rotaria magnacalcarata]